MLDARNFSQESTMNGPQDLFFYHHTRKETALEKLLPSGKLLFSALQGSNDPWEFEKRYFQTVLDTEARPQNEGDIPYVLDEVDEYIKTHGKVLCFSLDDWQKQHQALWRAGFCKPRMWAQYGDNHAGICIATSVGKLDLYCGTKLRRPGVMILKGTVKYQDTIELDQTMNIEMEKIEALENGTTGRRVVAKAEYYAQQRFLKHYKTLFTKHVDWADENEYRYLSWSDTSDALSDTYISLPETIEGIVVGCRFPRPYEKLVESFEKDWEVPVLKLRYFNGRPVVDMINTVKDSVFSTHVDQLETNPTYMPEYDVS